MLGGVSSVRTNISREMVRKARRILLLYLYPRAIRMTPKAAPNRLSKTTCVVF